MFGKIEKMLSFLFFSFLFLLSFFFGGPSATWISTVAFMSMTNVCSVVSLGLPTMINVKKKIW